MDDLDKFLSELHGRLNKSVATEVSQIKTIDEDQAYFTTPAPNAIEWAVRPEYLDIDSIYRHVRQYQVIRDFFQLRCPLPTCNDQSEEAKDCWGKSREYLQSENLLIYDKGAGEDVCPSCRSTRSELTQDGLLGLNTQMHLVVGMRAGKSSLAAVMGTYVEHRVITIAHSHVGGLAGYFNQMPNQPFEITFIASTDVQSADTVWAKFVGLRQNSPWLQKYVKWIKQKELDQQTPDGVRAWKYEELNKDIINGCIGVKFNSLNSNSGGLAGRTRLAAFIDELGRFENTDSARSADEAYRVCENSLRTIRSAVSKTKDVPWLGTMFSISSPISDTDKAMRLLKETSRIRNMYSAHYATWEFNPDLPRSEFDGDFEKDPVGAMRDFGARPPGAASPLIGDAERFRELAIQKDLRPNASFRQVVHIDRTGREYVSLVLDQASLLRDSERYICFDAGQSFDQFAGACAHGEWVTTPEGRQLVTVYDWIIRILPENKPRRDVWFDCITQMVEKLSKYCNIGRIDFDRWQSTYLIQQIRDRGISCDMKGTVSDQFIKFVNDVNFSRVRMLPPASDDFSREPPQMTAAGLAFYEIEHLERSPDMKRVHNPRKGQRRGWDSDDVATVVVHVSDMVQSSVVDIGLSNTAGARLRREEAGGHMFGSGGHVLHPLPGGGRGW